MVSFKPSSSPNEIFIHFYLWFYGLAWLLICVWWFQERCVMVCILSASIFFSPSHDWLMQLVLCALYRYYSHYHPSPFLFSVFPSLFPLSSLLLFFPQFLITSILSLLSPLSFLSPLLSLPSILYFLPLTSLLFSPLPSKLCTVSLLWRLVRILSYYCKIPFARYQISIFMTHKLHIIRYPCILSLIPLLSSSVSFLIEYMSFILPFLSHPCTNNNNIYSFICQQQL